MEFILYLLFGVALFVLVRVAQHIGMLHDRALREDKHPTVALYFTGFVAALVTVLAVTLLYAWCAISLGGWYQVGFALMIVLIACASPVRYTLPITQEAVMWFFGACIIVVAVVVTLDGIYGPQFLIPPLP